MESRPRAVDRRDGPTDVPAMQGLTPARWTSRNEPWPAAARGGWAAPGHGGCGDGGRGSGPSATTDGGQLTLTARLADRVWPSP